MTFRQQIIPITHSTFHLARLNWNINCDLTRCTLDTSDELMQSQFGLAIVCGGFVSVCHTLLQTIMINALLKSTVQSINFVVSIQFLNVQTNRSCSFSELIGATNNNIVLLLQFDIAFFN